MKYSYLNSDLTEEDIAVLQLSLCEGIGPKLSYQLLEQFGGALEIFKISKKLHGAMPGSLSGLSPDKLLQLQHGASFTEAIDLLKIHQKLRINMVNIHQPNYPYRIKEHHGAPLVLFYLGSSQWNPTHSIAIVGTRKPTQRGLSITQEILTNLSTSITAPWMTVSGLALGIDASSHKTSVQLKIPNFGVVAHGLEQIYPRHHYRLTQEMIEQGGAVISEHPAYTKMHPTLFPRRNRLIAALCDALVIIESGITGGSMVTAGIACHLNKEVFAVPGHPKDANSVGCNSLIQECMANLCISADDIINKMNWKNQPNSIPALIINSSTKNDNNSQVIQKYPAKTTDRVQYHLAEAPKNVSPFLVPNEIQSANPNQSRLHPQQIKTNSFPTLTKPQQQVLEIIDSGKSRMQDLTTALPFWSTAELVSVISQLQINGLIVRENSQQFKRV
jgi:DNA processing protein